MSRKLLITLIAGLIIILGALAWFFFFNSSTPNQTNQTTGTGLPFGQSPDNVSTSGSSTTSGSSISTGVNSQGKPVSKLFRVSDSPVAGMVAFNKNKILTVRFVDRATGHIVDADPTTLEKTSITNNTYPKIQEAYFKNDGSAVLLRDLKNDSDTIENISLALTAPKSITVASGTPPQAVATTDTLYSVKALLLNGNIDDVSVGPTNSLAYILKDTGSIITSLFDGSKGLNLFTSGFNDWRISWPTNNTVNITTKAGTDISGFSYNLNTTNGALTKILGPLNALTALESSDGKNIAYSYVSSGETVFFYKNFVDKSSGKVLPTTFADKCVWGKKNTNILYCGTPTDTINQGEPDNWYKGATHFSDQIWKFNVLTKTSEVLVEPKKDFGVDLDLINPILSPDEDYIFFINKNDLTLWALKLK